MLRGHSENAVAGRERLKRWLRIRVLHSQTRDLFYPVCRARFGPVTGARLVLSGPKRRPASVWINGEEIALGPAAVEGREHAFTLDRPDLILPGENVVSLPADCSPRTVRLDATECTDPSAARVGWGALGGGTVACDDPHLAAAARFLLQSLSGDPFGPGAVSLTGWDPERSAVRLWSWYWTTAVTYEALVRLNGTGRIAFDPSPLEEALLGRQILDDSHDVNGSYFVRWDPDRTHPSGVVRWHAPNDSAYIGLHGLLVAHDRTGDDMWLARAETLADWIAGPGTRAGKLRVGWNGTSRQWDDSWHYIDASWMPAFFLAVGSRANRPGLLRLAEDYARDVISRFSTDGPFYLKIWRANGHHTRTVFARGMGWVLEGWLPLIAAGHDWLRPRVENLLVALMDAQDEDGSWPYLLDQPGSGRCNKGTPVLACHLNRARLLFPDLDDRLNGSTGRALAWCESHMDLDAASPGCGGIYAANDEGAITTVRDISVAFNYGTAYYVLTRLERTS